MLMEDPTTLVTTSHELGGASDLVGIHIDLADFLPVTFGTIFQAFIVVTHGPPPADSYLHLEGTNCFETFVLANGVELLRSTARVVASRYTSTRGRQLRAWSWDEIGSRRIVNFWEEAKVST